ncbi:hypothetical protein AK88_01942 [Plasmodium fragile]|uniref:Schizont-infected cell agglutination extracellular alpha domain-containing protein n=1 Tax=Plasmodium fragile TaxID=5857 RepID=A0A0D9QRM0_PLAFR|nr:uncharacterized protein AK88_01942 [Plasmodium fragile]KJP88326.1 hypothetical protein AK88_01942 [Plasmodium fragile]
MCKLFHLQDRLSKQVDNIFGELTKIIGQNGIWNSTICGYIYYGSDDTICRSRCGEIVSLILYMKGYNIKNLTWTKRHMRGGREKDFREYLKCILAREALTKLYGGNNDHVTVIKDVSNELNRGADGILKNEIQAGVCEGRKYESLIFGSGNIGANIESRLAKWTEDYAQRGRTIARGRSGKCAWEVKEHKEEEKQHKGSCDKGKGKDQYKDEDQVMDLIEVDLLHSTQRFWNIVQESRELDTACEIGDKIKKGVADVRKKVDAKPVREQPAPAKPAPAKPVAANPNAAKGKTPVRTTPENTKTAGSTNIVVTRTTRRMRALRILLLASVIEECAVDSSFQEKGIICVDNLLRHI